MRRVALSIALVALVGCSTGAGAALLPRLTLRARARLERSESRARWRHDVRVLATFPTDARPPRPPLPEPPDRAPVTSLSGRLPCRVPTLCAWELRERRRAFTAFAAR